MDEPSQPRSHRSKLVRVAVWTLVGLYVVYLVAANLFLNAGLMSVILPKPEKMLVEIASGWSVLPGFIHVEGLRIRGQTKSMQWQGRVEEVDLRISLLALGSRRVGIRSAKGTGLDFRLRPRLTDETADLPEAAFFPEIEGFSNPPNPAPEDIYPPKKKKRKFGWHIDIDEMQFAGSIDVWMARARMTGTGSVKSAFDMVLRGDLELPNARFELDDGEISFDDVLLVHQLDISTDLRLGPYNPKEVKGVSVLDEILGAFSLENGEIPNLEVANAFLPTAGSLRLESGTASFAMSFDKPSIEAGSSGTVTIGADDADLRLAGRQVLGDVALTSNLVRGSLKEGSWEVANTNLRLEDVRVAEDRVATEPGDEVKALEGWWAEFEVDSGKVQIGQPSVIDVTMEFVMRNTDPVLALFIGKEGEDGLEFPKWVKLIPDITDLRGVGSVDIDADGTRIDDVVVAGDKFAFLARMRAVDDDVEATAYLRYKFFDLGIGMKDGKRNLKLFRPKKWFLKELGLNDPSQLDIPEWILEDR